MVRILYKATLDTEIIEHQTEDCFTAVMHPESGCVLHWMIPEGRHTFYQLLVRNDASLFEAIHALLNEHVDPLLVVNQCLDFISVADLL